MTLVGFIVLLFVIVILYITMTSAIKKYKRRQEIEDAIEIKRNFDKIDAIKKGRKIKRN